MRLLRVFSNEPHFRFMRWRRWAMACALAVVLGTAGLLATVGLNLGLDFAGGVLIEARSDKPVDLAGLRALIGGKMTHGVSLQTFGAPNDVLIRVQAPDGGTTNLERTVAQVSALLQPGYEIRRSEYLGPQVSSELLHKSIVAAVLAVVLIGIYVWFRFEWQFGLCAVLTTFHDVIAIVGLIALLRLEFSLPLVAALLTIAGYSINDTVVVFDRIRENMRLHKRMALPELIDRSVNQTLSRTVLTSGTTLLAVLPLLIFGGPILRDFALAITWGILVGTVSSVYVAAPLLLLLTPHHGALERSTTPGGGAEPAAG